MAAGAEASESLVAILEVPPLAYEPPAVTQDLPVGAQRPARIKASILDALAPFASSADAGETNTDYIAAVDSDDNGLYRFFRTGS